MAVRVYQGENKDIVVPTNIDLSSYTEIEFRVDTPSQIIKKLSNGEISGVTSSQFTVAIIPGDTETVEAGNYKFQVLATASDGKLTLGKFKPDRFTVEDSIFTTIGSGNDYN